MSGAQVREVRQRKNWTQQHAADRLGVSQAYLSMVEAGRRQVSRKLLSKLRRAYDLPPTALPAEDRTNKPFDPQKLANTLGVLRYPGFSYLQDKKTARVNPASLLLQALRQSFLEPRLAMALPWLAYAYADLDWDWLLPQAKLHELQNRLGFVVSLARQLAERHADSEKVATLARVETALEHARLVREDTFCRDSMTNSERRWLRDQRPQEARRWNLLTSVDAEQLSVG